MKLKDLFQELSFGELSNLAAGEDGDGEIDEKRKRAVVMHANDALLRLFSRFILKEKNLIIEQVEYITHYHFLKKYAQSQYKPNQTDYPYIQDLYAEPFQEDVIKVLSVYNQHGQELPLNDDEQPFSLFTPQMKMLQVPHPVTGAGLSVIYQAKHSVLKLEDLEAEIELPDVLHSALKAYIAHKIYSNMNTDVSVSKGQEHLMNYESLCAEAESKDLLTMSTTNTNTRFFKRGWI